MHKHTRIVFNSQGKPCWIPVPDSGAWLHNLDAYRSLADANAVPFTQGDRDWFRKPLK